ncbi:MAG: type II 3-dehydroquinate dehydratase [Candidatus Eremiobacteraeota bacterium]|nr:type II 3-dehydroquinate dehydratase [Candidatus Eremiobacteraeota bacterium]
MRLLVIHGPSLNLLGSREPQIYGSKTLDDINHEIATAANELSVEVECKQFNDEGDIIDAIHAARSSVDFIIINPGAYSHYSHAIADAIAAGGVCAIEVHLTQIFAREPFRRRSVIAPACVGTIAGFGALSYVLAMRAAAQLGAK